MKYYESTICRLTITTSVATNEEFQLTSSTFLSNKTQTLKGDENRPPVDIWIQMKETKNEKKIKEVKNGSIEYFLFTLFFTQQRSFQRNLYLSSWSKISFGGNHMFWSFI